eukprot:3544142-Amphidinium_carterae.1
MAAMEEHVMLLQLGTARAVNTHTTNVDAQLFKCAKQQFGLRVVLVHLKRCAWRPVAHAPNIAVPF